MVKGRALRRKVGDTLIEVTLAIGIFSMVAIAAVSVINASVSSTQGILENTLTREQIDAQAEALRFIQAAYAAEGKADATNTSDYARLWNTIASRAVNVSEANKGIVNYNPNTCAEVYNDRSLMNRVFIINTMALGANKIDSVIVTPDSGMFHETTTYPRIVYRSSSADDQLYDSGEFLNIINATNYKVNRVEGLFVLAVNDSTGTTIVSDESGETYSVSAYIDFYIRSCWYAVNAERPSTISTVIRLYNPNSVAI